MSSVAVVDCGLCHEETSLMTPTIERMFAELDREDRARWQATLDAARGDLARAQQLGDSELIDFCQGRLERLLAVPT